MFDPREGLPIGKDVQGRNEAEHFEGQGVKGTGLEQGGTGPGGQEEAATDS